MAWHNYNCKDDPWVRFNFLKLDFAQPVYELDHLNCAGMRRCWSSWSKWRWQGLRMRKEWWSFIACFLLPFEEQSWSISTFFCCYDCPMPRAIFVHAQCACTKMCIAHAYWKKTKMLGQKWSYMTMSKFEAKSHLCTVQSARGIRGNLICCLAFKTGKCALEACHYTW